MTAVSNAGPLIHLTKIGQLDLLKKIFEELVVPKSVWLEVVERGKEGGKPDAFLIGNADWIKVVEDPPNAVKIAERAGIHEGEACAILLVRPMNVPVLLDDAGARKFAQGLGLTVVGSIGILIRGVKEELLTVDDGLNYLEKLANAMWLSVDVYEGARKIIEGLRK